MPLCTSSTRLRRTTRKPFFGYAGGCWRPPNAVRASTAAAGCPACPRLPGVTERRAGRHLAGGQGRRSGRRPAGPTGCRSGRRLAGAGGCPACRSRRPPPYWP
ncbi:hypothetical protein, partial [Actinoplanes octamycinicus]|uniref:hypothetical protein n=1 Tax=Actinoplanes octamycinicus TaxID=135948 RepID=UPI0035EE0AEC